MSELLTPKTLHMVFLTRGLMMPMVIVSTMVIASSVMTVSSLMTVIVMRGVLLERGLRMMLVDSKPSLSVLCLHHAILQSDSLVQQSLVVGSIGN